MDVFLAMIVMPFSRSRSIESMHALDHVLVGAEDAGLPEHGVDQGGLAVVDVGDDGDVPDVRTLLHVSHCSTAAGAWLAGRRGGGA